MRKNTALNASWSLVLLLALALGFGCAPKSRGISDTTAEGYGSYGKDDQRSSVDRRVRDYLAAEKEDPRGRDVLISTAKTALGTPYVRGGTSTDGFDCSGFVQWTFNQVGVKLPRTAREQSRVGKAIRDIDDVQVGDIVAFHHPKRGYHTGIYVGDGKFIHSPRKRTRVRINSMDDPYFSKTFMGARRIGVSSPEDIEAAERMLAEYREQEVRRSRTKGNERSTAVAKASNKRGKKESARSLRSSKNKESASSRKAASKGSKDSKKSVGQAKSPASQAVAKADRSSKGNDRASRSASAVKQQNKDGQGKKASGQKSSDKKSSDKKSADSKNSTKSSASKTGNSQKKGS